MKTCFLPFFLTATLFFNAAPAPAQEAAPPVQADKPSAEPPPLIPNFWDSKRRLEKPLGGSISKLRFLTVADFPPFNFSARTGALMGFNVDLARALCLELDLTCTVQARAWEALLPALKDRRGDVVIAGHTATAALRQEADLSEIYFKMPARFVMRAASPPDAATPETLRGKTIGAVTGSAHAAFLNLTFDHSTLQRFGSFEAATQALQTKTIDALFADGVQLAQWLNSAASKQCCAFRGGPYLESRFFGEGQVMLVKKGNAPLLRLMNYGLQRLFDKGTYAELYLKWFPVGVY